MNLRSIVALSLALAALSPLPAGASDRQVLTGHVPAAVAKLKLEPVGRLPGTNQLRLAIGLPLRHTNELAELLEEIYAPASPQFRQYLTPDQFAQRFGPTVEDFDRVRQFVVRQGLEVTGTSSNRVILDVMGPAETVEKAFNVKLRVYAHPKDHRTFYAPDAEPSVEAGLPILDIGGLNNYTIPRRALHPAISWYSGQAGTGSGPNGSFIGKDFRNAYVPSVKLDGTGQMVGLTAFSGLYTADIAAYEQMAGLPGTAIEHVLVAGFNGIASDSGEIECALDIDMATSMAPGLSRVVVFDAGPKNLSTAGFNDILAAMVNRPEIKQLSSSGWQPPNGTTENLFRQMALQGQSFFVSSGDDLAWSQQTGNGFDDPLVTSVGGTTLFMNGGGASYASERVWNWGFTALNGWYSGSGGGIGYSGAQGGFYPIPSWQKGLDMTLNGGSTRTRNCPDVAAVGDNVTIVAQGFLWSGGGTSCSAPLWAGFCALVNQEAAAHGRPAVGFLNPALYALGESSNYTNCFHDVTVGNNIQALSGGLYTAVPGYDLCTGWGTPNGSNLITALALPEPLTVLSSSPALFSGPVGGPFSPLTLSLMVTNQAASAAWSLGVDSNWLVASPASGRVTGGAPGAEVTVAPNGLASHLPAGSYTASLWLTNSEDGAVQNMKIALEIFDPPVITSQPASQSASEGMTASFSVGTATNEPLAYQWQFDNGSGPTSLANGGGISGAMTRLLTISNVSAANAGAYSVIITNSVGTISSARASLNVVTNQAPAILFQPTGQKVPPGASAGFTVSATGDAPLSYTWLLNGTNVINGGKSTLVLGKTTAANAGNYSVIVSNKFGSITSSIAPLNLTSVSIPGVTLEALYTFGNPVGFSPFGGLVQASDGNFYGTAIGWSHNGAIYRLTTNGAVSLVYSGFDSNPYLGFPVSALVQGTNGDLYGTANNAGGSGDGFIFHLTRSGAGVGYYRLNSSIGSNPLDSLIQGQDGSFYGTAFNGGAYGFGTEWGGYGTVFTMTPGGTLRALVSFNFENGSFPLAPLVQARDGTLYGVTSLGGANGWSIINGARWGAGYGTIFQITPAGVFDSLFSFANTNGAGPIGGLTFDPQGNLYGTTYSGGSYNAGTIFKLDAQGTFTSLYSFTGGLDGSNCFAGLLLASDGNFYGTAESGGTYGMGTVFRMSPGGTVTTLAHFDGYQGATPEAALIQGKDGSLYGTTLCGGAGPGVPPPGLGTIYRLSLDGPLEFTAQPQSKTAAAGDPVSFSVATFGALPTFYQWLRSGTNLVDGGNIQGSNSRVLRLASVSLADAAGYSVIVSNSYGAVTSALANLQVIGPTAQIVSQPVSQTVLAGATVTFTVGATGAASPSYQWQENGTNLVDGGNIFGAATATLTLQSVAVSSSGSYSVVVSNGSTSTSSSSALLAVVPVTVPSAGLVSLYTFPGFNSSNATSYNPYSGVVQGADSNLYGTTLNGGTELAGTAFSVTPAGVFTLLYSFTDGADGANPQGSLLQLGSGNFYGTSLGGLPNQDGAIFQMSPGGALTPLYRFGDAADGGSPLASVILGSDGQLYGTASSGGTNGVGTLFSLSTNGVFTPLWSFDTANGSYPAGPLLQARDGRFYGTTSAGGSNALGTVFSFSTNGVFGSIAPFASAQGAYPSNGLMQASDGAFYGTTAYGGTNGDWGTVFRLTADGALSSLHSFGWSDGARPTGGLLEGTDGNLYGTTSQGGLGGEGTVFQITTNGVLTTVAWFDGPNGANPQCSLIQANDGFFYGTTRFGGPDWASVPETGNGVVFRLILPMFVSHSLAPTVAMAGVPYAAALSTNAVEPSGDAVTFAKVSGPAWLIVAANGALSGTPELADLGPNSFTVSLVDANGWSSSATLPITVVHSQLVLTASLSQGQNLVLSWTGGQSPSYQLQSATNLATPVWQDLGAPTTNTSVVLRPAHAAAFYRIQGQ
jgi:uncharacterized repeat protein (TIGR03803 family)